jgi:gamma-butyrobetaine dioxygenase
MFEITAMDSYLEILWEDKTRSKFHWLWLRDFCRCATCYNESCHQKYFDCADISLEIKPSAVAADAKTISIVWPDGHQSVYSKTWLKLFDYSNKWAPAFDNYPSQKTWDTKLRQEKQRAYEYGRVIEDDDNLLSCLDDLLSFGITIVKNVHDDDNLSKLIDRLGGFVERTYFGSSYDLIEKPADSIDSVSFSRSALPLHTDIPYYDQPPAFQFLYSVEVSESAQFKGCTQFVDGLHLAKLFRDQYPLHFKRLSTTKVLYRAYYPWVQKEYIHTTSVIHVDQDRQTITFVNNPTKMFFLHISFEEMTEFYAAYGAFKQMLKDPKYIFPLPWQQGIFVLYDNRRIFHGREAFGDPSVTRILRGGYFGYPEVTSRYFYLKNKGLHANW